MGRHRLQDNLAKALTSPTVKDIGHAIGNMSRVFSGALGINPQQFCGEAVHRVMGFLLKFKQQKCHAEKQTLANISMTFVL